MREFRNGIRTDSKAASGVIGSLPRRTSEDPLLPLMPYLRKSSTQRLQAFRLCARDALNGRARTRIRYSEMDAAVLLADVRCRVAIN
jgi:hypothetical protein